MENDKDCAMKIFHNDSEYTPNNFDIYFDTTEVPSNIEIESAYSLEKRLNKLMPLSKRVHLNLGVKDLHRNNSIHISSIVRMNDKEVKFL
ncbi:hypothetical protein [Methanobrevibacter sp.]|uniref:hypothetical protein n=1 Tax=Methanobrevibacter sp. TaxID=66852 RepID=UPI00388E76B9